MTAAPIPLSPRPPAPSDPGPSVPHPSAPVPSLPGPPAPGPSALGPSALGPSALGPSALGPSALGPSALGPSALGPSALGPSAAGAAAHGEQLSSLAQLLEDGNVLVLSGAGLSTESGIPDYRGPSGARRRHTPMTYQEFVRDPRARHRYWARSYVGWRQIRRARPNAGHRAVADLEAAGLLGGVITQNVDGLHQAAGARAVMELHGGLDRIVCLACQHVASRAELDDRLAAANPGFGPRADEVNPDGDVDLPDTELDRFVMVECAVCGGGPLKPDVVFFGETVPRARVEHCFDLLERSSALLVLGSSLTVMSGYRFVLRAEKLGLPIGIVNLGPTRGDAKATLRVDAPLGRTLTDLARQLAR